MRTAFQKLEFYGIVKTYPQSGTVIAEHTAQVLEGLISDVLQIDGFDFYSLVHVRVLLEVEAVRLCALNRTEEDLAYIMESLDDFERYAETDRRIEKDFAFHNAIARGGHNPVIASLLLVITPDVLDVVCTEHRKMLEHIVSRDADAAEAEIRRHLAGIIEFAGQKKS